METRAFERLAAFTAETLSPNNPQTRVVPDSEMWQTICDSGGRAVATVSRPYRMGETGQGAGLFRLSAIDGQPVAYFPNNPRHCDVAKAIRAFIRAGAGLADMGAADLAEELADSERREIVNRETADSAGFDTFRASALCRAIRAARRAELARERLATIRLAPLSDGFTLAEELPAELAEAEAAPEACPCPDCGAADLARPEPGPRARAALAGAEARGRAIVAEELARAFALRIKPAERPALGRAARALAELDSLGLDLLNPDWRDVLESGFGFGPAARSAEVLA